jgi:hypothetical protein
MLVCKNQFFETLNLLLQDLGVNFLFRNDINTQDVLQHQTNLILMP